jgi:hypothetical protein
LLGYPLVSGSEKRINHLKTKHLFAVILFALFIIPMLAINISTVSAQSTPPPNPTSNPSPSMPPLLPLEVVSLHGQPNPRQGVYFITPGSLVGCSVSRVVVEDGKTWICNGWYGTGSVPQRGYSNSFVFTINMGSAFEWLWVPSEKILEVPYQFQGDTNWCTLASLSMVLHYYGVTYHSWDYAALKNMATMQSETVIEAGNFINQNYGPNLVAKTSWYDIGKTQNVFADIRSNLTSNFPVIVNIGNILTSHSVVAVGFNDSGLFVNDPSGALFDTYLKIPTNDPRHPSSFNQAFISWQDLSNYIRLWPYPSIVSVEGIPKPAENSGTIYVRESDDVVFKNPTLKDGSSALFLDHGLSWKFTDLDGTITESNVIRPPCTYFSPLIWLSNSRSSAQSFRINLDLIDSKGNVEPLAEKTNINYRAYSQGRLAISDIPIDLSGLLKSGEEYRLGFYLYDSSGNIVDYFRTEPFYWGSNQPPTPSPSPQPTPSSSVLRICLGSPANLLVTSPDGFQVGYDSISGSIINEIEGATYTGPGTEPQVITIPNPSQGSYIVQVVGTGTGGFTVTMQSLGSDDSLIDSEVWTGVTVLGQVDAKIAEFDGAQIVQFTEPPSNFVPEVPFGTMMAFSSMIIAMIACVILPKRGRKLTFHK